MDKPKFNMLYPNSITESIHNLTMESSKLKTEIFKATVMDREINKEKIKYFISYVNNFLKYWEDFSEDMKDKMENCKGSKGIRTLQYQVVKEYIYGRYDYAAVLQFTDGIIKGNEENKFKDADDIKDFFEHTIEKAFDDLPDSVAGLLDAAVEIDSEAISTSDYDAKMFDSIKTYKNLFNEKNRIELYKAISKTVDFIGSKVNINKYLKHDDIKLFISAINHIVEFITYSLSVYAVRIYVINRYAYPFIYFTPSESCHAVAEAVELPNITEHDLDKVDVNVLRLMDDSICKDYTRTKDVMDTLDSFTTLIGADNLFGNKKPTYGSYNRFDDNIFSQKLLANALYKFITDEKYRYRIYDENGDKIIQEMNQVLKTLLFNDKHGLQGSSTAKQELLHIIRGAGEIDSIKDCKEIGADLLKFTCQFCVKLQTCINDVIKWKSNQINHPTYNDISIQSLSGEVLRMLTELYSEVTIAIIQRGRDVEDKYNHLFNSDLDRVTDGLTIRITNNDGKHNSTVSNISNSVPDTTRMPIELSDLYALPAFESMQMYDDYLRSLDMFKDDPYLSEAVNISEIINKIQSFLAGLKKKWTSFIHNKEFQSAVAYVTDNEQNLLSLQFTGAIMEVLPFKNNGSEETINPSAVFKNLTTALKSFDEKTVLSSMEELDKFVVSLYPSENVYKWFNDEETSKTAAIRYRNYILYNDESSASDKEVSTIKINDGDISKRLKWWIDTVKGASAVNSSLENIDKEINTSINSIKTKIVNITNKADKTSSTPPSMNTDDKSSTTTQKTDNQSLNNEAALCQKALTDIQLAVNRLYGSIIDIFIFYFRTEYRYIQEAYTKGKK